ncbi:MAG: hypothetical protein Q8L47_00620 [bacterium]|nr:hypothetical protein [bacterium]
MNALIKAIFVVAILFSNGLALKLLWGWFMVPIFGLPLISLAEAIGICLIVGFLTSQYIPKKDEENNEALIHSIASPVTAIVFGWIIHLFM